MKDFCVSSLCIVLILVPDALNKCISLLHYVYFKFGDKRCEIVGEA